MIFNNLKICLQVLETAFIICFLALSFASCSSTPKWVTIPKYKTFELADAGSQGQSSSWSKRPVDEIAPGYLISIRAPDPKIGGEYRVEFDNSLKLPYNVRVNTAGLKEDQLKELIRESYRPYFRSPKDISASISKKEYLVEAQGLINKPGRFILKQDSSLDDIIAQAGGLQQGIAPHNMPQYARISGPSGTGTIRLADYYAGAKDLTPSWQGGETVFFQTEGPAFQAANRLGSTTIHILGEVKHSAEYPIEDQGNLFSYLIKAGGPTDRADLGNVTLIRSAENGTARALNFSMLEPENVPEILPGDAIILNADNATPMEKKSRVGASFANIVSALGIIVIAAM